MRPLHVGRQVQCSSVGMRKISQSASPNCSTFTPPWEEV
ncbi:hypothetical protein GQ600_21289 [Phytophthora cactorum]|nr:hypothetical protein GQ600_21289 [Phytophthora cactorum]